ncbi:hypothetical protein B566_EDAN013436 [Ephemera danica]|nr:hypothetical protein B566_EDAN013436 [Ephemera danica]
MHILREYVNAVSIVATIFLGSLCLHIKATYGTFITEDVHQILPYLLISLGFARIFLFYVFMFAEDTYRHFKGTEISKNANKFVSR